MTGQDKGGEKREERREGRWKIGSIDRRRVGMPPVARCTVAAALREQWRKTKEGREGKREQSTGWRADAAGQNINLYDLCQEKREKIGEEKKKGEGRERTVRPKRSGRPFRSLWAVTEELKRRKRGGKEKRGKRRPSTGFTFAIHIRREDKQANAKE